MKKIAVINDMSGYGRCSLTVALPLLSVMGCQACPVPTSILSNHTAYADKYKKDLTECLVPYFDMWQKNGFHFDAVMSGYLGKAEQTAAVHAYLCAEKAANPAARVVIDPVMADHGKLYCSITAEHIEGMRKLCSTADLISPNLTEACFLTGMEYETLAQACAEAALQEAREEQPGRIARAEEESALTLVLKPLLESLHALCKGTVVITGIEQGTRLLTLVSEPQAQPQILVTEKAGANRPGTGDMFVSILTARWLSGDPAEAAAKAACDFIAEAIRHSDAEGVPVKEGVQFEDLLEKLL